MTETETETETEADADAEADAETSADRQQPSRTWLLAGVALLLAFATAAAVVWGLQQRNDADEARAVVVRQREAALAASGFVETLMSYDHENIDTQQSAVEGLATESFAAEYGEAFTADVRQQIVDQKATSTVTVQDVYLTVDDGDEATAIVVARSDVSSAGGASAELESFLRIRLVRLDGSWRVDELTSLGSRDRSVPLPGQDNAPAPPTEETDG